MDISNKTISTIETVLNEILTKYDSSIYEEQNKQQLNAAIKDFCDSDDQAKEILLTLVVNDVFLFINDKDFNKVEINTKSCLTAIGCDEYTIKKIFEILKVSDSLKKLKRKKILRKLRNKAILITIIAIPVVLYIYDYRSYFRSDNDVQIPGGEFQIVDNTYIIDSFFISKTEVTESQYFNTVGDNKPKTSITWYDAIYYCNKLSKLNNLDSVYTIDEETKNVTADFSKNGYRLPTKVEWYRAAKGTSKKNKDDYSGAKENSYYNIGAFCWYLDNSEEKIHNVKQKKPNSFSLYDMSGNASEWCWDYYWDWTEKNNESPIRNPTGPSDGVYRSVCGGFFGNSPYYMDLVKSQSKHKPNSGEIYCGFRVARSYVKMNKNGEKK